MGKNSYYNSPFAQGAKKAERNFSPSGLGGKHDDISVTVAQIFKSPDASIRGTRAEADKYFDESIFLYTGEVQELK